MMNGKDNRIFLGTQQSAVEDHWLSLEQIDRRRHMYIIGQTGSGKSTLLTNCILQDIQAGRGVALIDPHGDSADLVIDSIPAYRRRDVLYLNPSDLEFPVGFNPLRGIPHHLKPTATANLIAAFRSIWRDFWGPRMEHILSNTIAAMMEYPDHLGISLLAVPKMLTDETYRRRVLRHVKDPVVLAFWQEEFSRYDPRHRAEIISPILNKMGAFTRSPVMRNILGQSRSSFDLSVVMNQRKILVVNLSKGLLGEDMTNLLGSLLVCAVQQEAMKRAEIPEDDRVDFHLYIDEFQNFTTDAFDSIVSEARKYRLSLCISHQYTAQISESVRKAILGNVGNLVLFSLGGEDAEMFAKEILPYQSQTLRELSRGQMLVKGLANGISQDPILIDGYLTDQRCNSMNAIINNSRTRFANDRAKVENRITRWLQSHAYV